MENTFGIHCIPQKNLFFNILDSVSHEYTLVCYCRGWSKNEKCPIAIADLVLLYKAAQEGLYCPQLLKMTGALCIALYMAFLPATRPAAMPDHSQASPTPLPQE